MQTCRFHTSFWLMRLGLSTVLQDSTFFFFPPPKRLYFPLECVCWVLSVAQFASPAFPTKKWVERGGNTIATIMNHCNARNMITKWLSSSIDNQSSLCGFYIPVAFSIYLINSFLCLSLSALVWS